MPRQWLPGYLSIRPYTIFLPFLIIWLHPQWIDDIFQPFLNMWAHICSVPAHRSLHTLSRERLEEVARERAARQPPPRAAT